MSRGQLWLGASYVVVVGSIIVYGVACSDKSLTSWACGALVGMLWGRDVWRRP
jgi:hypothetical protein